MLVVERALFVVTKVFTTANQKSNKRRCYEFAAAKVARPSNMYNPYKPFSKTYIRGGHVLGCEDGLERTKSAL